MDNTFAPQSLVFYSQILPIIYQTALYVRNSGVPVVGVLDIGSASGAGPNLVKNVLNNLSGIKTNVTAIDIDERFLSYSKHRFPELQYLIGNVFNCNFNDIHILTISHTLEHVDEPIKFIEELRNKFPNAIQIYYVPWKERNLIPDHRTSFNKKVLSNFEGLFYAKVLKSVCWRTEDDSRVITFVVKGDGVLKRSSERRRLSRKYDSEFANETLNNSKGNFFQVFHTLKKGRKIV